MKPQYLLSVFQTHKAYYNDYFKLERDQVLLKRHEVDTLAKLCALLDRTAGEALYMYDGFFVGFSIPQIANEFDLLRFGTNYVINIELKSPLPEQSKQETIYTQMKKQFYYLKFLGREIRIFTYIEDDGFWKYDPSSDSVERIETVEVVDALMSQAVDYEIDPEREFKPSNYLVSPFNKVESFVEGEYFLTTDQAKKKKEIIQSIENGESLFFCISAEAGTGKTLLTYDIAKEYKKQGKNVLVIHCAALNAGQQELVAAHGWDIRSAKALMPTDLAPSIGKPDLIVIDESHRLWKNQLERLVKYAKDNRIHVLFSYDVKQYLKDNESTDIHEYLVKLYPSDTSKIRSLTTKIRTNKKLASFINNMMRIGSSNDNLDYENVSVEYFSKADDAQKYMKYLDQSCGFKAITFTPSQYSTEPADTLSYLCEEKAHGVIGQEFEKVVFAMDNNFAYNEKNILAARKNYYSLRGMFYQIVTRAVNELKVIVIDNPELYSKIIAIKQKGNDNPQ